MKYIGNGTRHIDLVAYTEAEQVHVVVRDTGIGIPPEHLGNIFERFYRVRTDATDHITGSGLGLSIVKAVVTQHGGTVSATSTVGTGTAITLSFPKKNR